MVKKALSYLKTTLPTALFWAANAGGIQRVFGIAMGPGAGAKETGRDSCNIDDKDDKNHSRATPETSNAE